MKKNNRIKISVLCGVILMALTSCGGQTVKPVEYQPNNPQYYTVTHDESSSTTTVQTVEIVTDESSSTTAQTTAKSTTKTTAKTIKSTTKTTVKTTTTKSDFDISYWISYAKSYAKSVGLNLNSGATACWDNPITANASCIYLERDIKSRLNRYSSDPDITDVWIWYEKINQNSYNIYIGYA